MPGVYIFAKLHQEGKWHPLYVGETDSLAKWLAPHDKWPVARLLGATHIHALIEREAATRVALAKQLIATYLPELNIKA